MIIRQQKSERVCASFHVSAYKTKVLIIICAAKLLYCNGFAKQGGAKNVKESVFLSFLSKKRVFCQCVCDYGLIIFYPRVIFLPTNLFLLPTHHTNLHEFIALYYNGDLFGRTNFH